MNANHLGVITDKQYQYEVQFGPLKVGFCSSSKTCLQRWPKSWKVSHERTDQTHIFIADFSQKLQNFPESRCPWHPMTPTSHDPITRGIPVTRSRSRSRSRSRWSPLERLSWTVGFSNGGSPKWWEKYDKPMDFWWFLLGNPKNSDVRGKGPPQIDSYDITKTMLLLLLLLLLLMMMMTLNSSGSRGSRKG